MSLSPLEIAKAFDTPLLRQVGSNVSFKKMEPQRRWRDVVRNS